MRRYVDHVLALLPFEPEAHRRLGGPPCTYVGHPLIERLAELRPAPGERRPVATADPPELLVLPGSRSGEIRRHMEPFGSTLGLIADAAGPLRVTVPAVDHLAEPIAAAVRSWPVAAEVVVGPAAKLAAFRRAHAALAASGTVTLELALSGVPMAVGYKVDGIARLLRRLVTVDSIVLPNLILGDNAVPEFVLEEFQPAAMTAAVVPLLSDTPDRARQTAAFERLDDLMTLPDGRRPSEAAAAIVLDEIARADRS
jgi:lipid-A-disaccharide synthase